MKAWREDNRPSARGITTDGAWAYPAREAHDGMPFHELSKVESPALAFRTGVPRVTLGAAYATSTRP